MTDHQEVKPDASVHWTDRVRLFLQEYSWAIARNVIGWLLMVLALPIGFAVPGPLGFPIFIIGFALVTFPGKRKLTARVLRGRRLNIETRYFAIIAGVLAILIPAIVLWIVAVQYKDTIRNLVETYTIKKSAFIVFPLLLITLTWLVTRLSLKLLNGILAILPTFRRKFRPWLRKKGLKLLPPRRRKLKDEPPLPEDEILEIDPHHQHRIREAWLRTRPWVRRAAAFAITAWIFAIMIEPLYDNWPIVREQISAISWWRFAAASLMFALLLLLRAMVWRRVLKSFGHRVPAAPAARIWATSEMARYLPGTIWQVVGRVFLARPYGVPAAIVTTSQILEVGIFLFANVLIAGSCLLYFGAKIAPQARPWLITAIVLVPTLAFLLHPKIFYSITNYALAKLNKPVIGRRLRGAKLVELLVWMVLGLVIQSIAVYLITDPVLRLKAAWWWVVAGAYCLAWCAGFLAFWAPGGIGVRELVFVTTMQVIAPNDVQQAFGRNPAAFFGLLVFLGFVLRAWTIAGEVLLVAATHVWDYRGAIGDPTAPGRIPLEPTPVTATPATPATPTTPATPSAAEPARSPSASPSPSPSSSSAARVAAAPNAAAGEPS